MSQASFTDHKLRVTVYRLLEILEDSAFALPEIDTNETYAAARDRLSATVRALKVLLAESVAELVSLTGWTQIDSTLQPVLAELTAFTADKQGGHISNASAYLENLLPLLWAFGPSKALPSAAPELLKSQSERIKKTTSQLLAQREELQAQIAALSTQLHDYSIKLESLKEGAAKERAEAAAAVAKLDQAFAEKEAERATAFGAAVQSQQEEFSRFEGTSRKAVEELISHLTTSKEEAARIVQVVGNIGVTSNYQQIANSESMRADNWRLLTLLIFGGGMALAIATFCKFWAQPLTPENAVSIAIRLLYALAITAPAWYTARESARHRTNSDTARQTELELASIGPFIELMPEEKKVAIREQLIASYFGKSPAAHEVKTPFDTSVLKDLGDLVKAARA